ncbi:hypothetical protein HPB50_002369 [Hyalomma asiaticum]|uniref:Uncharacterized protein n=1 Tax=Hyalomma asiaticum TaxID=266040 RepID=A0ACB7TDX3_HYAAI|nr:hypothetical protein HPB50_002369 [Hyalomma asiaticum]
MNPARSPINLQRKFPKTITRTVLIGDSQIKYMHTEFNPNCAGTLAFICQPGARIEDLHNPLQFVPATATTVILHAVFKECPSVRRIFGTLILPRTTNRRRGNNNGAFVCKVNTEASFFNQRLHQFCRQSAHVFYVDHGFEFLPARRVLAADGLHTNFKGTALLASHIKDISFGEKRNTRSEQLRRKPRRFPTSQEEFPRLPPPPPHPAPSLPHAPNERIHRDKMSAGIRQPQSRKAPSQHN